MAGNYAGFSSVQLRRPQKSSFDLSHEKRMTTRMGKLTPVLALEAVPSDTFRGSTEILLRLAPLLAPIYDQIELYVHYFFVPNRLLWDEWETFITGGRLGVGVDPVTAPVPPFFNIEDVMSLQPAYFNKSQLPDYMGVPTLNDIDPSPVSWTGLTLDAMPFAAYTLIFYEYYMDRNVEDDAFRDEQIPMASGENEEFDDFMFLRTRNYSHDYFTSALPFTQRGEEVLIPLDGQVTYLQQSKVINANDGSQIFNNDLVATPNSVAGFDGGNLGFQNAPNVDGMEARIENIEGISNIATTINDFRSAYALQVWLERNAVGGSRYTESTQAHFGVKPQDSRLQRPEYIGGGRIRVKISEVVSTAWSNDGSATVPLANMGGHGVTYGNTNQFRYFCTEHGFILGIASIMNPPSYQQGLPRMFRRRSFLDYPWPTFAKLGEQPVFDYELYCDPASLTEDPETGELPTFGYQSRYADWKYMCTTNHGDFRDTLLFWTLTRVFDSPPNLNVQFLRFDDTTQDRIFAVPSEDSFWMYVHNEIHVSRPLPYFGTPNTMGFS